MRHQQLGCRASTKSQRDMAPPYGAYCPGPPRTIDLSKLVTPRSSYWAQHCSNPGCPSWIWLEKSAELANCQQCQRPWIRSYMDIGPHYCGTWPAEEEPWGAGWHQDHGQQQDHAGWHKNVGMKKCELRKSFACDSDNVVLQFAVVSTHLSTIVLLQAPSAFQTCKPWNMTCQHCFQHVFSPLILQWPECMKFAWKSKEDFQVVHTKPIARNIIVYVHEMQNYKSHENMLMCMIALSI